MMIWRLWDEMSMWIYVSQSRLKFPAAKQIGHRCHNACLHTLPHAHSIIITPPPYPILLLLIRIDTLDLDLFHPQIRGLRPLDYLIKPSLQLIKHCEPSFPRIISRLASGVTRTFYRWQHNHDPPPNPLLANDSTILANFLNLSLNSANTVSVGLSEKAHSAK